MPGGGGRVHWSTYSSGGSPLFASCRWGPWRRHGAMVREGTVLTTLGATPRPTVSRRSHSPRPHLSSVSHAAGDEALQAFAGLLTTSPGPRHRSPLWWRGIRRLARRPRRARAVEVAERTRERTESTIIPLGPGQTGRLTVTIGIALLPDDGTNHAGLLKAADEALYRAELGGRNRIVAGTTQAMPSPKPARRPRRRPSEAA